MAAKRRRRRKNVAASNPRRRRRYTRRRRRSYRRNPPRGILGQLQTALPPVGWGVVGVVGTAMIPDFASRFIPLPTPETNPMGHYAVRAGAAVGTSMIVGMVMGRRQGQQALVGGGVVMAYDLFKQFLGPQLGLSDYLNDYLPDDPTVSGYLDEGDGAGYLSPGETVGAAEPTPEIEYTMSPTRLSPGERF